MPEREPLRRRFNEMLETARMASAEYDRLAKTVEDPFHREQLELLSREGQRHVELTERLIEIVNG